MIERCVSAFPVRLMCRCLNVSASGYYGWHERPLSQRARENRALLERISTIHEQSDGVFGSPRVHDELRYEGQRCSRNRVARLMRAAGLRGIPQRRRWRHKASGERPSHLRNHLDRNFVADEPNAKWVTDITYIRTGEGWLYLSVVIDLCSRIVVGWSMSPRQDRQLVLQAVLMALWQRPARSAVILHSDRGCQFTSEEYQRFLTGRGLTSSMSAVGSCADNAAAESFFGVLKRERVNRRCYLTRSEARADVFDYIECFYNPIKRRGAVVDKSKEITLTQPSVESG
jgi:putative transposase